MALRTMALERTNRISPHKAAYIIELSDLSHEELLVGIKMKNNTVNFVSHRLAGGRCW